MKVYLLNFLPLINEKLQCQVAKARIYLLGRRTCSAFVFKNMVISSVVKISF